MKTCQYCGAPQGGCADVSCCWAADEDAPLQDYRRCHWAGVKAAMDPWGANHYPCPFAPHADDLPF